MSLLVTMCVPHIDAPRRHMLDFPSGREDVMSDIHLRPPLLQTVWAELQRDASEFQDARTRFEQARYQVEIARRRYAATMKLADETMTAEDRRLWYESHPNMEYLGRKIGDAIDTALMGYAFDQAKAYVTGDVPNFDPALTIDAIMMLLERGGFEFSSVTPLREINGALINLKYIKKVRYRRYRHVDADAALSFMQDKYGKAQEA